MYTVWSLMKMILPKKLLDRIHIHSSYDELYSIIDKDILPKEYGGKENSLNTIMGKTNSKYIVNYFSAPGFVRQHFRQNTF